MFILNGTNYSQVIYDFGDTCQRYVAKFNISTKINLIIHLLNYNKLHHECKSGRTLCKTMHAESCSLIRQMYSVLLFIGKQYISLALTTIEINVTTTQSMLSLYYINMFAVHGLVLFNRLFNIVPLFCRYLSLVRRKTDVFNKETIPGLRQVLFFKML